MYAVIETGGQQLKVEEGDIVKVQKLPGDASDKIVLDKVLMVRKDDKLLIGQPYLEKAKVQAEVLGQDRDKKVVVYKKKRRTGYEVKRGHRQPFTQIKILQIKA